MKFTFHNAKIQKVAAFTENFYIALIKRITKHPKQNSLPKHKISLTENSVYKTVVRDIIRE